MERAVVLVVDDDRAVREALAQTLELEGMTPLLAGSFVEAKDHITAGFEGVILSDMRMPGRDGFHLLQYAQGVDPDLPVILLTGQGDIAMAVRAMGLGAFDFLEKPCAAQALLAVLGRALKTRALVWENRGLRAAARAADPAARMIFGTSPQAEALRSRARSLAALDLAALVTGPRGAGIAKVAEVIHLSSTRRTRAFVRRQSAALDEAGFEAALLEAAGGTLFLDEIETLGAALQYRLAEALEAGLAARVIAGGPDGLAALAETGGFNAELYYHLEGMSLRIPALRERPEDIAVIFGHYVRQAAEQTGLAAPEIGPDVVAGLMAQDWPGNARALMSAAMRFVLGVPDAPGASAGALGLAEQMAQVERSLLVASLGRHQGKAAAAAEALKLPRKTFYDKLARYGLKPEDYR
ncbi:sigma-54 dependent transcriptional regulator [uncultured Lentibacter sp.]|jgi:two-component system C4-dicarboxylate transport response regulator DctD|uniref:sigma-54-dependent transcriptional regulator n=1 Tax=uncultured Lentibacter sp. TaxID=1659309 RepID=UPI0026316B7D|nr:sigma-54 dependent transcriptional regulator [uncultured Lentibacter sp.]